MAFGIREDRLLGGRSRMRHEYRGRWMPLVLLTTKGRNLNRARKRLDIVRRVIAKINSKLVGR